MRLDELAEAEDDDEARRDDWGVFETCRERAEADDGASLNPAVPLRSVVLLLEGVWPEDDLDGEAPPEDVLADDDRAEDAPPEDVLDEP